MTSNTAPSLHSVSVWSLAWRQLTRDFRAGELRLLFVAVALAVAALTAVGFFADRLNAGLSRDATQLLGGDAIVASDQPTPLAIADKARALGLLTVTTTTFPSMGRAADAQGGASRLVSVKAVSDGYPLRGKLRLTTGPGTTEEVVARAPAPGSVWVEAAVLDALALKVGDDLLLGDATLRIAQVIAVEPDRGAGFIGFSPRVMLNQVDLASTGLIQPASRVTYRLLVASKDVAGGNDPRVREFTTWTEAQL